MGKVIITGAGASAPYNFPTSGELRDIICTRISEPFQTLHWINQAIEEVKIPYEGSNSYENFSRIFKDSMNISIDMFLTRNNNKEIEFIGKLAIAYFIYEAEKSNNLYSANDKSDYDHWLFFLFNLLTENCHTKEEAEAELQKIKVITFNYDRSFEFFFSRAFYNTFFYKNAAEFEKIDYSKVPNFNITHVYGYLGDFKIAPYPLGKNSKILLPFLDNFNVLYDKREVSCRM